MTAPERPTMPGTAREGGVEATGDSSGTQTRTERRRVGRGAQILQAANRIVEAEQELDAARKAFDDLLEELDSQ